VHITGQHSGRVPSHWVLFGSKDGIRRLLAFLSASDAFSAMRGPFTPRVGTRGLQRARGTSDLDSFVMHLRFLFFLCSGFGPPSLRALARGQSLILITRIRTPHCHASSSPARASRSHVVDSLLESQASSKSTCRKHSCAIWVFLCFLFCLICISYETKLRCLDLSTTPSKTNSLLSQLVDGYDYSYTCVCGTCAYPDPEWRGIFATQGPLTGTAT
jgi:hypothetical protein